MGCTQLPRCLTHLDGGEQERQEGREQSIRSTSRKLFSLYHRTKVPGLLTPAADTPQPDLPPRGQDGTVCRKG